MQPPLRGSCQCGAVTYSIGVEPLLTYACHCHSCQKRTGSAFSLGLVVSTDELAVHGRLTPWTRISDQGNSNTRYSCAACGNIIYGIGANSPALAKVQAGTLEDTREVEPEVHLWTVSRQPWVLLPANARLFEGQPDPMAMLQAAIDYRAERAPR